MDENLNVDVWVVGLKVQDGAVETVDGFEVIILSVDDPDQSTDFSEDGIKVEGRVKEVKLTREVPDLEIHERATTC